MDKEFLEDEFFGGERKFFVDTDKVKYSRYSWSNIMNPQVSGQERADLYREGVEAMQHNPNLPDFFKDVFRNAYIPFRDSETINLFLKEINEFTYNSQNSEDLGEAYEMLLSIMSSQGEAGQFRTPRHIIDMIVNIVQPSKNDRILDPACGTAGFLISAYKYILNQNLNEDGRIALTPDDKARMMKNFEGYDISQDMVRLSRVNMYLHHFSKPKIYEYDTLTSQDRWDDQYDVIFANPPFMTPKGGINPHNRFRVQANRSEILFVDYIAEHLAPNGRAGIIVPEGVVFQSSNAYKQLRKYLVDDGLLYAVISLPAGVFNPYSGVKTSILLIDKDLAKSTDEILFIKMNNDGFDLGSQRKEIKQNDISKITQAISKHKENIFKKEIIELSAEEKQFCTIVKKESLQEQDYMLVGDRYQQIVKTSSVWEMVELNKLCEEIRNGINVNQIDEKGKYRVTRIQTISDGIVNLDKTKWTNDTPSEQYFMKYGDILLSHINSYDHLAKSAIFESNELVIHGINLIRLRPKKDLVNPKYLSLCMKSNYFIETAKTFAQRAVNQASIKTSDLKQIKLPLPPLSIQREIVEETERYQKIIDGAKQVVDNYKPTIKIDSNWKIVKLGEVCEINSDTIAPTRDFIYLDISSVENGTGLVSYNNLLKADEAPSRARRKVKKHSVLLSTVRPNLKAFGYIDINNSEMCIASTGFAVIDAINVNPKFIYYSIFQDFMVNQMIESMGKGAYPSINQGDVVNLKLYLPPLEIQQQIVNKLDEEVLIVKQNRRMIEIFEQRIKEKINEVWDVNPISSSIVEFPKLEQGIEFAARNCSDKFIESVIDKKDGDSDE